MRIINGYIRTDLACEMLDEKAGNEKKGYSSDETDYGFAHCLTIEIHDKNGEAYFSKPSGKYTTFTFKDVGSISNEDEDKLVRLVGNYVRDEAAKSTNLALPDMSVMLCGLGNRFVTPDAIGPVSADKIIATRHIKTEDPTLFQSAGCARVSVISPGVLAQTGIETFEVIKGMCAQTSPSVLIVIDALASRSSDRLATTIQISDSGITPGSGIGNRRMTISRDTLGIPVIAIGIPTVVDSSTIVYDAISKAGINDIQPELKTVLESGRAYFVAPKDIDLIIEKISVLISNALNFAFSEGLSSR